PARPTAVAISSALPNGSWASVISAPRWVVALPPDPTASFRARIPMMPYTTTRAISPARAGVRPSCRSVGCCGRRPAGDSPSSWLYLSSVAAVVGRNATRCLDQVFVDGFGQLCVFHHERMGCHPELMKMLNLLVLHLSLSVLGDEDCDHREPLHDAP